MNTQQFHSIRELIKPVQNLLIYWPGLLFDVAALACWINRRKLSIVLRLPNRFEQVFAVIVALLGLFELTGGVLYLLVPVYFDHVEPLIPSIAYALLHGKPIYPPISADLIYGSMYGPLLFEVCALGLKTVGATVMGSKAPFVAAFISAALITYLGIRKSGVVTTTAVFSVAVVLVTESAFQYFPFWTRSEPVLLLLSSLALFAFTSRLGPSFRVALISSLAGAAFDLKPHGVLFMVPWLFVLVYGQRSFRQRAASCTLGAVIFIATAVLPFTANASSVPGIAKNIHSYYVYLHLASGRGLSMPILINNIFVVLTFTILAIVAAGSSKASNPELRNLALAASLCSLVTSVVGSIPGGGSYHLLAYLPIVAYILGNYLQHRTDARAISPGAKVRAVLMATAFLLSFGLFVGDWPDLIGYFYRRHEIAAARADVEYALKDPGAGVVLEGTSETSRLNGFLLTMRELPIFANQPLIFDEEAWLDLEASGFSPAMSLHLIENCRVNTWLIPGAEPFKSRTPTFPPEFIHMFHANYQLIRDTSDMRIWRCKDSTNHLAHLTLPPNENAQSN